MACRLEVAANYFPERSTCGVEESAFPEHAERFRRRSSTLKTGRSCPATLSSRSANGLLAIRGDKSANNISIQQTASGIQVSSGDSGATEINGGASPFTAASVTAIRIQLKGGDNSLQIGSPTGDALSISGKLAIGAAGGNNTIAIANATIGKGLAINVGHGDDTIVIGGTSTTAGEDPLNDIDVGAVSVGANLSVSAGAGNDSVAVVDVSVKGKTALHTGSGDDNVALMSADGATLSKSLVVNAGSGTDQVLMDGYTLDGNVSISTHRGNDTIGMFSNTFGRSLTIAGGPGDDSYQTNKTSFPNTFNGPAAHLRSLETQSTDVLHDDPAFTKAFAWASDLLQTTGLFNSAPTAINQTFSTAADTSLTTGNLLTGNSDPESDTLSVASVTDSSGSAVPLGTATKLPSGALLTVNANGTFTYNPNGAFGSLTGSQTATDTFNYKVGDNYGGMSATAGTVTITITTPSVQNPVAASDSFSTNEGVPLTTSNLLSNDTDPNAGATLSVASVFDSSGNSVPLGTATKLPSARC